MTSIPRNPLVFAFIYTALACLTPGCGGDDDDGDGDGGGFSPSVAGTSVIGNLSQSEWDDLCGDVSAYFASSAVQSRVKVGSCRAGAIAFASLQGATDIEAARTTCNQIYELCISGEPVPDESPEQCTKPSSACMATVAELGACSESIPAAYEAATASLPACNELTAAHFQSSALPTTPDSPACQTLRQKCPEFQVVSVGDE